MTDQNLSILERDINDLLTEEYGSGYRIITYEPRPNISTGFFGITLTVEVTQNGISRRAHARKENNLDLMKEIKDQIGATQTILEKHYL